MVLINRVVTGYEHRRVGLDNVFGAEVALRLLLSQGHQRIGYLSSDHPVEDGPPRQQGYSQAMATAGLSPPDSWRAYGSPDLQGGEAAMVELLRRNLHLSAIFAYNDAMAVLKENGITVPQHFSLAGFDDIPIARYTTPKLASIRYPIVSMAILATELTPQALLEPQTTHMFMPTLVRRHSVAPWQSEASVTL